MTRPFDRRSRVFFAGVLFCLVALFAGRLLINRTTLADYLVMPLLVEDTSGAADAIVVLGAAVVGECTPNLNGVRRVVHGLRLWREKRAPLVHFTGGHGVTGCPVATAMSDFAREIGLPASSISVETSSMSTRENALYSAPLLRAAGVHRVLVVTDRLHMRRAAAAFAGVGFAVDRASVPIYEGHPDNVDMLAAGAREALALGYYRARGWLTAPEPGRTAVAEARDTELFMHSSSTNHPTGPIVVLGASYAGRWNLPPVAGSDVVNLGVSGQQSFEMLERFERDVVSKRPRAVILWGFINDIFRSAPDGMDRTLARVRESYTQMIALARRHGIEPILTTEVTIRGKDTWTETFASMVGGLLGKQGYQDRINQHVMATNRWMMDLARRERLLLLDLQGVLAEDGGRRRREYTAEDGSHITQAAYDALTRYARPILEKHFAARTTAPAAEHRPQAEHGPRAERRPPAER